MGLTGPDRRRRLLESARRALEAWLESGRVPRRRPRPAASPPQHSGVFVTLTYEGRLRGCVGSLDPQLPLDEAVPACAVSASTDSRFDPLSAGELERTRIEISILAPWRPVRGPGDVSVGRDGLMVRAGPCRGLLLPKVAVNQGWDAGRFLEETCRKAGLPPGAWRLEGAEVHAFEAEVFGEEEPPSTGAPPGPRC